MTEQQLVSCEEVARILLDNPHAEPQIVREFTAEGVTIVEDWAGRPAVTAKDAQRKVAAVVKARRAAQEEYDRNLAVKAQVHNAQRDRDILLEQEYMRALRNTGKTDKTAKKKAAKIAIAAVRESEKGLPREVRKQLKWLIVGNLIPTTGY